MKNKIIDIVITLVILGCLFSMVGEFYVLAHRAVEDRQRQDDSERSVSAIVKILDANKAVISAYDARISRLEKELRIPDVRPCSVTTCTLRMDK
jgi:hypothetical protein